MSYYLVSINSPSGEGGGGFQLETPSDVGWLENVSINSPSGEGGGKSFGRTFQNSMRNVSINSPSGKPTSRTYFNVSINSPSGEGGGYASKNFWDILLPRWFPLILLQAKAGGRF